MVTRVRMVKCRTRTIDRSLLQSRENFISFVAAGNYPDWSTWGVRDVAVRPA